MLALVVDDDTTVRTLVRSILLADNFETIEAADGDQALKMVNVLGGSVDVIITDIQMPGMDGVSFANAVTRAFPCVPIVLMSGYPAPEGDFVFVQKPFSWMAMRSVIRRVIRKAYLPPAA
jgi:CheY-like chemotaxis protein